jgi:hypothetical protein
MPVVTEEAPSLESLSDLQDELRYLLNRWDPIGIYDESLDFPPDEYDCLLGPLLIRASEFARGKESRSTATSPR